MHEILHKAPEIVPPAVLSTEDESVQIIESQDDSVEETENFVTNFHKRRRRQGAGQSDREAAIERHHAEKMESGKILDLFQQMIDKM